MFLGPPCLPSVTVSLLFTFSPSVLKFTAWDGSPFTHHFINLKSKFETCEFWVVLWCFTIIHTLYIDIVLLIQNIFNASYSCSCSPLICIISEFLFPEWCWYFPPTLSQILLLHYWFSLLFLFEMPSLSFFQLQCNCLFLHLLDQESFP